MASAKALVIARRLPLPLKSGAQLRIYHTLRGLSNVFDVTLVALTLDGEGAGHVKELETLGVEVHDISHESSLFQTMRNFLTSQRPYSASKFHNEALQQKIKSLTENNGFDFTWVHFLTTLSMLPPELPTPLILDQHNVDTEYWRLLSNSSLPERTLARLNLPRLEKLQKRMVDRIDVILSVSERDADQTRKWAGDTPVWVVPNGVDIDRYEATKPAGTLTQRVVFVGSLDRRRNQEALDWFVGKSWPRIQQAVSGAQFDIVGRNPSQKVLDLASIDGVCISKDVPDVVPYYEDANVVVAPFRLGSGTKLKVLEALSMARPLVSTPKGVAGINVQDGKQALIRQRGEPFTNAVIGLLQAPERREALGDNARELCVEAYAWDEIMSRTVTQIHDILNRN